MSEVETTKGFICYECLNARKNNPALKVAPLKRFQRKSDLVAHKLDVHGIDMRKIVVGNYALTINKVKRHKEKFFVLRVFDISDQVGASEVLLGQPIDTSFHSNMTFTEVKERGLAFIDTLVNAASPQE